MQEISLRKVNNLPSGTELYLKDKNEGNPLVKIIENGTDTLTLFFIESETYETYEWEYSLKDIYLKHNITREILELEFFQQNKISKYQMINIS